jgi:hypothetical protein
MWIATNRGFLSVVAADPTRLPKADRARLKGQTPLCVRARRADHLRAIFPGLTVYEWKGRDYPARLFIGQDELADIVAGLVRSIRYPNFKSSVADRPLHDAYMGVWSVMRRYQDGGYDPRPYDPAQHSFYDQLDQRPFNEQFPDDDDEPCTTPGCSDLNPCLDCIIDAMGDDPRSEEELLDAADQKHRAQMDEGDLYGPYDTGDDRDLDDGAESHRRIAP